MKTSNLSFALVIILAMASSARADGLGPDFNWDDDAISKVARSDPGALDKATTEERARLVGILMDGIRMSDGDRTAVMNILARTPALQRFQVFRSLDKSNETDMRKLYDKLGSRNRVKLLELCREAGAAATAAGVQEIGIISDIDDTAIPTSFHPDGLSEFKGAGELYNLLEKGTDGNGASGDLHFVSAQPNFVWPVTRLRLDKGGIPEGTVDNRANIFSVIFGGLDGIQSSKDGNIDIWLKLHPGQKFVFLGDTRQRDPEVYRDMMAKHGDQVALTLIHNAGGKTTRTADAYPGEVFFDTYADARKIVLDRGIVGPGALQPAGVAQVAAPAQAQAPLSKGLTGALGEAQR